VDFSLGARYFFQAGFNTEHGSLQNYNQWFMTFGYRFDNRMRRMETANNQTPKKDDKQVEVANANGK
jgi:hypothetical protein